VIFVTGIGLLPLIDISVALVSPWLLRMPIAQITAILNIYNPVKTAMKFGVFQLLKALQIYIPFALQKAYNDIGVGDLGRFVSRKRANMEINDHALFGQCMKKRRKELDLTQEDLAKLVGCAMISIQSIEAGRRRPSKQMAELIARQLDIPESKRQDFIRFARTGSERYEQNTSA
jgi:DNA-binding XRE family transcriptional regulator